MRYIKRQTDRYRYIQAMKCYSTTKRMKFWHLQQYGLESIILSEVNQTKKDKCCMILVTCGP